MNPRAIARPIVQVTCSLAGDNAGLAVGAAREVTLTWLRDKQGIMVPQSAWNGEPFEIDLADGRPVMAEAFDNVWALRYDNPDSAVPSRFWRTEVVAGWADSRGMVGVRLSLIPGPTSTPWTRSVPRLVLDLVRKPGLNDYGFDLSDKPWIASSPEDVESFVSLLESPHRTRPVYVISEDADGYEAVDSGRLASRTAGIAHVVRISGDAGYAVSDVVGKRLSVYNGAIRTYRPGFSKVTSQFDEHPIATPDWLRRRFVDPRDFVELLVDQATDASVSIRDLENRLPSFTRVREFVAARRVEFAKKQARSDRELVVLYEEETKSLKEDREAALQLSQELERSLEGARRDAADLRTDAFQLRARIALLESALSTRVTDSIVDFVDSYDQIGAWAARNVPGKLKLLPRALRAVHDSQYSDIRLVQDSLLLLANEYRNMRLGALSRDEFETAARTLGTQVSPTGDVTRLMQYRAEYEVEWPRGRNALLDMHLKKGAGRESRNCLRIYFLWDAESEQVIVGQLTEHLTSDIT